MGEYLSRGVGNILGSILHGGRSRDSSKAKILGQIRADQAGIAILNQEGAGESFDANVGRAKVFANLTALQKLDRKAT